MNKFKSGQWVRGIKHNFKGLLMRVHSLESGYGGPDGNLYYCMHPEIYPNCMERFLSEDLEPAYPKAGEWWEFDQCAGDPRNGGRIHSETDRGPFIWDGDALGLDYIEDVKCGCTRPVNYGKGHTDGTVEEKTKDIECQASGQERCDCVSTGGIITIGPNCERHCIREDVPTEGSGISDVEATSGNGTGQTLPPRAVEGVPRGRGDIRTGGQVDVKKCGAPTKQWERQTEFPNDANWTDAREWEEEVLQEVRGEVCRTFREWPTCSQGGKINLTSILDQPYYGGRPTDCSIFFYCTKCGRP